MIAAPLELEDLALDQAATPLEHAVDAAIDFAAGTSGGIACVYTGQSLDTVKVKMQSFPELYKTSWQCFMDTYKKDGVYRGLYAGTVPALAANIAENSVLFAAYGFCQKGIALVVRKENIHELNPVENALSGSLAAIFASIVLCPTELIKCRLQALREMHDMNDKGQIKDAPLTNGKPIVKNGNGSNFLNVGPLSLTRQILRDEGIKGMFRGLGPTFAREVPGYFFFFGGYELSRHFMTPKGTSKDDLGAVKTALCGGMGGMALWISIFPADVVKSRVQISGKGSLFEVGAKIFKEEGILALYSGLGPSLVRTFFASGALFVAYELTKKSLHKLSDPYFETKDDLK